LSTVSATTPLRLRPLEIGDLLDETFRMYCRHFVLFAGLSVICAIPTAAVTGFTLFTLFNTMLKPGSSRITIDPTILIWFGLFFVVTLALVPLDRKSVV
jgi:hypothetical protein